MRDGTYHYAIRLHAPIGLRYGMLELCIQDRTVSGALTMFSQTHPITDVCLQDGKLCFGGQMQTLLYFLPWSPLLKLQNGGTSYFTIALLVSCAIFFAKNGFSLKMYQVIMN